MDNYSEFIKQNQTLLDCYGSVDPNIYIRMDSSTQKDVCFSERSKLEEYLIKGKVNPSDFFAAAK